MFATHFHENVPAFAYSPHGLRGWPVRRPGGLSATGVDRPASERDLWRLRDAFGPSGGVATGDEVAALLGVHCSQPISLLARSIVAHKVVSFQWQRQTLLPLFQFDLGEACVWPSVARVISELTPHLDDAEIADWFAAPNAWLSNRLPADAVLSDEWEVLQAARAARFVARGG